MLEIYPLRAALKYGLAAALAGAYAVGRGDVLFIWYPLVAVVNCMDDTESRVMAASRARLLGTIVAGVMSFLLHTILLASGSRKTAASARSSPKAAAWIAPSGLSAGPMP